MWISYRLQWTNGGQYSGAHNLRPAVHPLTAVSTGDWLKDRKHQYRRLVERQETVRFVGGDKM